jgi:hypothetical protein
MYVTIKKSNGGNVMSKTGSEVFVEGRKFKLTDKGVWPFATVKKFASQVLNGKGNDKPLEEIDLGKTAQAVIKGETITITRIA